jgi:hypothetical protein
MRNCLAIWTVYERPLDYPDKFVARLFEIEGEGAKPTANIIITPDLQTLREILTLELHLSVCLPRHESDDPQIVECWL